MTSEFDANYKANAQCNFAFALKFTSNSYIIYENYLQFSKSFTAKMPNIRRYGMSRRVSYMFVVTFDIEEIS